MNVTPPDPTLLRFTDLTPPVLGLMMRAPSAWRVLTDVQRRIEEFIGGPGSPNGSWMIDSPAASIQIRLTKYQNVRAHLLFRTKPDTVGPDSMHGKRVTVAHASLPETIQIACQGRRLEEVVDCARFHHSIGPQIIRRVSSDSWKTKFFLKMPFVQPSREDWKCMTASASTS